ncbi:MAG: HEAT repeat domain-containing protein [Bryobacterales bacterium]|nr:HEAT repeat domain-containing protein [Bryobacterales bacterium]
MKALLLFFPLIMAAQPRVGWVEIFGAKKVPPARISKALRVNAGDPIPASKTEVEENLQDVPDVVRARVEGFCCQDGKVILYVGIEERGASAFQVLPEPDKDVDLPAEITAVYRDFASALARAAASGQTQEDLTRGHSLMADLPCRTLQDRMAGLAELHEDKLREVLRQSGDPEQRAIAAYVIGYAKDKSKVIDDLQVGLQDPDEGTRRNAARALKAIAFYGSLNPGLHLRVQPTWFVEMLNSSSLSDRLEGANALLFFTDKPNEIVLDNIRDRAMASLYEMSQWQYLPHALPAYLLLGRVSGKTDQEMQDAWSRGERESAIQSLRKSRK